MILQKPCTNHQLKYLGTVDAGGRLAGKEEGKGGCFCFQTSFLPTSVCQCDIHLLEAALHKQTAPKATTGWLNNHRLFSLFSTIVHCKFHVGPLRALLCVLNK